MAISLLEIEKKLAENEIRGMEVYQDALFNQPGFSKQPGVESIYRTQLKKYREKIEGFEWNWENFYGLGLSLECGGNIKEAQKSLITALRYQKGDINTLLALTRVEFKLGELERAKMALCQAILASSDPTDEIKRFLNRWKLANLEPTLLQESIVSLEKSVEKRVKALEEAYERNETDLLSELSSQIFKVLPDYPRALKIMGLSKFKNGHFSEAIPFFSRGLKNIAILKSEERMEFRQWYGRCFLNLKQYSQAEPQIKALTEEFPKNGENFITLGYLQAAQKKYKEALIQFDWVANLKGKNREKAIYFRGLTFFLAGQFDKALNDTDILLGLRSNEKNYHRLRVFTFLKKDDLGSAISALDLMEIDDPTTLNPQNLMIRSHILKKRGDKDYLQPLLKLQYGLADNPEARTMLLRGYWEEGKYKEVIKLLTSMSVQDYIPNEFKLLAWCYAQYAQYDNAFACLDNARQLQKGDDLVSLEMGRLHFLLNEVSEGQSVLRGLTENPNLDPKLREKALAYLQAVEDRNPKPLGVGLDIDKIYSVSQLDPTRDVEKKFHEAAGYSQ